MGNERFKTAAPSPSSWSDESSSIEHGVQSRPLQSPRKPWRKKSAAATSRRTVIETAGIDDNEEVVGEESSEYNPRSFPYHIKQACWEKAEKIKGRDPDRWRRDRLGNIVFRKLVGCSGCLCHDYDHIHPYSKGAANRAKSNHTDISTADLIQKSAYCRVSVFCRIRRLGSRVSRKSEACGRCLLTLYEKETKEDSRIFIKLF